MGRWSWVGGTPGRLRYAEAEAAFADWLQAAGVSPQLHVTADDDDEVAPPPTCSPHLPPTAAQLLARTSSSEPALSASASQVAPYAVGVLALPPRELLKAMHTAETALAAVVATDAGVGVAPAARGGERVELSSSVRTSADAIDVHLRRREMVGLRAAPPRLTALERACGRALKAVHLLALGACLCIQTHARCYLALVRRLYATNANGGGAEGGGSRAAAPSSLGASSLDELLESEARPPRRRPALPPSFAAALDATTALRGAESEPVAMHHSARARAAVSATTLRILLEWRARLDPTMVVKNENTFLAPLILRRRREAAMKLQAAFQVMRVVRWRHDSLAARAVQREWKRHVQRQRLFETQRRSIALTRHTRAALDLLKEEIARLEASCQLPDDGAVSPGLRALALVRGRVLDSCAARIRGLVTAEAQRVWHRELTRLEVQAILRRATAGLFPEAEAVGAGRHGEHSTIRGTASPAGAA